MFRRLLADLGLARCPHQNIGTAITIGHSTTVFCRDCAQRVEYDWGEMKTGRVILEHPRQSEPTQGEEKHAEAVVPGR